MLFWIFSTCLFVVAALFVLVPLWRNNQNTTFEQQALRRNANIALFQERSNELESELALGNLDQAQFDVLLLELQRSLLADVNSESNLELIGKGSDPSQARTKRTFSRVMVIPVMLVLLLPIAAFSLYERWGYFDDVALMGLFQRTANNVGDVEEAQALIVELGGIVQQQDDLPWAWYFLAENFANLGMFNEAEIAYGRAAVALDDNLEKALVLGRVALAKYINADLSMTPEIQEIISQARAINPNEISILQLLAADAEQRQDYRGAIEYWRLMIQSNPNSEQAQSLRANITAAQALLDENGQESTAGPTIEIKLALGEGVELDANLRVFIAARNAERQGMPPLAATDLTVGGLPTTIRLDNSDAVGAFNLASADTIYISALVSYSGTANPQSGDYRVVSENFAPNGQHAVIELVLTERVP